MPLQFGIPSLDGLLEIPSQSIDHGSAATSLAILGPDGSGKSVLALHLASQYRADCLAKLHGPGVSQNQILPLIVYVSSDFQHESASTVWNEFKLDRPNSRYIPFERTLRSMKRLDFVDLHIKLQKLIPGGNNQESEVNFLHHDPPETAGTKRKPNFDTTIGFLDLARYTAGDDWNFVNSLLSKLELVPMPKIHDSAGVEIELRHLMIIDSVAGFETFVGELDAFGLKQTRRSRIAQSMRNAVPHAHLVFVVEEPDDGKRLPEEYVTDMVVRLRSRRDSGRTLRTVEVEKARARNHALGEHPFEIRGRGGSSTGAWENADTPVSRNAYVHVFHSLSHRNLLVAMDAGKGKGRSKEGSCRFGLGYLDKLLGNGLESGSTASIIGDNSTGKSVLGEKFLAEGLKNTAKDVVNIYAALKNFSANNHDAAAESAYRVYESLAMSIIAGDGTARPPTIPYLQPSRRTPLIVPLLDAMDKGARSSVETLKSLIAEQKLDSRLINVPERREVLSHFRHPPRRRAPSRTSPVIAGFRRPLVPLATRLRRLAKELGKSRRRSAWFGTKLTEERMFDEFVKRLFRHPNLRNPCIVLTTGDKTSGMLADRFLQYLGNDINVAFRDSGIDSDETKKHIIDVLRSVLEEQILVRRFDIDRMSAPVLFEVVQRNVIEAQYLIHCEYFPPFQAVRARKAHRIRLMIDDFRVLSNLCTSIDTDSAFLPFLIFFLEREGVTSLIVHTDSVRPGVRPENSVSQALQSLSKQVILTWSVPFEGQTRSAISVVRRQTEDTLGVVRELRLDRVDRYDKLQADGMPGSITDADVTPKFELYAGLEEGRPRVIPLAVYLFNATPAFKAWMDEEDRLYRSLFVPIAQVRNGESGRVIWPLDFAEYSSMRDLTHLPLEVKSDHTLVLQAEGFWSLDAHAGALASQWNYFTEVVSDHELLSAEHEDPFGLFSGSPLFYDERKDEPPFERRHYFQNPEYRSRIVDYDFRRYGLQQSEMPDRVPFMWDFAFLLAAAGPWERCRGELEYEGPFLPERPGWWQYYPNIENIAEQLQESKRNGRRIVPWRAFLGAARQVAEKTRQESGVEILSFDFASTSLETLTSLVLEIWLSEVTIAVKDDPYHPDCDELNWDDWCVKLAAGTYREAGPDDRRQLSLANLITGSSKVSLEHVFRNFWKTPARGVFGEVPDENQDRIKFGEALANAEVAWPLATRKGHFRTMPIGALALYKTWLLLVDVLEFKHILDSASPYGMRQPKKASPRSVASRHFYRTACDHLSRDSQEDIGLRGGDFVFAMPGCFAVRGDTFLTSLRSSRSRLMASHAFDLLSTRRANMTRMQMGLGLPVRDVMGRDACRDIPTALRCRTVDPSRPREHSHSAFTEITYGNLCDLGASHINDSKNLPDEIMDWTPLWLSRNAIPDYDRVSRALQKWLTRLLQWTVSHKASHSVGWESGFKGYDYLSTYCFSTLLKYDSFEYFGKLCDLLVFELRAAQRRE